MFTTKKTHSKGGNIISHPIKSGEGSLKQQGAQPDLFRKAVPLCILPLVP